MLPIFVHILVTNMTSDLNDVKKYNSWQLLEWRHYIVLYLLGCYLNDVITYSIVNVTWMTPLHNFDCYLNDVITYSIVTVTRMTSLYCIVAVTKMTSSHTVIYSDNRLLPESRLIRACSCSLSAWREWEVWCRVSYPWHRDTSCTLCYRIYNKSYRVDLPPNCILRYLKI